MGTIPEDYKRSTRGLRGLFIVAIVLLLAWLFWRRG